MVKFTGHQLHYIYREIAFGRGGHGSFLRAFSDAYIRADGENKDLLDAAANNIVKKYRLNQYLDNFSCPECGGNCDDILKAAEKSLHHKS